MSYRFEVIQSESEFLNKGEEWKKFEEEIDFDTITCSYDYLYTFWKNFKNYESHLLGVKRSLLIVFLYRLDKLIAIAPFMKIIRRRKRFFYVTYIEFLGQQLLSNYLDFISKDSGNDLAKRFFEWLYNNIKFDLINLTHIPDYSPNFELLKVKKYPYNVSFEFNLREYSDYKDFVFQNYSSNQRHHLRQAINRISKKGWKYNEIVKSYRINDLDEIVRLSRSKLKDNKYCIYDEPNKLNFLKDLYRKFDTKVCFIKINDFNVAYNVYFIWKNKKLDYDVSYDRDYAFYSVGNFAYDLSIRDSFHKGVRTLFQMIENETNCPRTRRSIY